MATNDELLKIWAQQNGSDYNVLARAQNGNTQTTPTATNTNNDIYSEYGWNSGTLPGTNIPTSSQQNEQAIRQQYSNVYSAPTSQASQTTPTPATPAQSVTPAATQETVSQPSGTHTVASTAASSGASGTSVQDYINYYTSRGITQPPMSYEEWVAWMLRGGGSAAPTGSTGSGASQPASSAQPTGGGTAATNPYPYMQDYIDYYTALGRQPDMSYDEWVSWRNSGGTQQTTTPSTAPTQPTQPTTPSGLSTTDYINYYTSRGITSPPMGYEEWVAWMQNGGEQQPTTNPTTPTNPTNPSTPTTTTTQGTSVEDYVNYYKNLGMTTPDKDYETWVTWIQGGGSATTPTGGGAETGGAATGGEQSGTGSSTVDAMTEWQQIMARVNAGQGTIADYYRLQELAGIMTGGGTGTGTGAGTGIGGIGGTGGTGTGTGVAFHEYPAVNPDREQAIRNMYDAQINAERAALQEQGDQALSDAQANRDNIAKLYNQQRNAASVEWERQRRNFLEGAASSGLNTGAGSQAELSMMSMAQREQNNLGAAQAGAEAEADRNMADIRRSTQAAINEAVMKNDYQKAAALLDEYNEQYNRAMDRAEALAQYGDFSGYAALYGNEAAAQMRQTWVMSNPEIALALGLISQSQYAALTLYSQYPALALSGGTGFSGGGGGDYSGSGGGTGSGDSGNTSGGIPSYSGMSPGTYASIINNMIASGEISGADVDRAQELIRQAYAQNGG